MKISLLSIKPNKKIPEELIFSPFKKGWYNMASTKTGAWLGCMQTSDGFFKDKKALSIDGLFIEKYRQGHGTKFLNFAKNLSKKDYDGNIFLEASSMFLGSWSPEPHVFYRKNGFTTDDKTSLSIIDWAIKTKRDLYCKDIRPTVMYWQDENK